MTDERTNEPSPTWERDGDLWRKRYPSGREAVLGKYVTGWDFTMRYPSGYQHRADRYYTSKSSAMKAADRCATGVTP